MKMRARNPAIYGTPQAWRPSGFVSVWGLLKGPTGYNALGSNQIPNCGISHGKHKVL